MPNEKKQPQSKKRLNLTLKPISDREAEINENILSRLLGSDTSTQMPSVDIDRTPDAGFIREATVTSLPTPTSPSSLSSLSSPSEDSSLPSETSPTRPTSPSNLSTQSYQTPKGEDSSPSLSSPTSSTTPSRPSSSTSPSNLSISKEQQNESERSSTSPSSPTSSSSLSSPTRPSELIKEPKQTSPQEPWTSRTSRSSPTSPSYEPISPTRDFTKVPNSIVRDAVPAGLFVGKMKQLYDYLYSQTRGAIVPKRIVRLSREELMQQAAIGSIVTLKANVKKLQEIGLIRVRSIIGSHGGNEYEVLMPGEARPTSPSSPTNSSQKLDGLVSLETSPTSLSQVDENTETSEKTKTSFKTQDHDDDIYALRAFLRSFFKDQDQQINSASKEIINLLIGELRERVGKASNPPVSPAYFVECVRRLCSATSRPDAQPNNNQDRDPKPISKGKLKTIVDRLSQANVGRQYSLGELAEDTKLACARDGVLFDNDLFNEIIASRSRSGD